MPDTHGDTEANVISGEGISVDNEEIDEARDIGGSRAARTPMLVMITSEATNTIKK